MIKTATQLKAKVRNLSGGDSLKAQTLIRNFIMERFLERVALSKYRNHFVLKGGMLVASVVGLGTRATMDIDASVRSLNLTKEDAVRIIEQILSVEIPDGVQFAITKVTDIMEEHDYPGIRIFMEATLDSLRQAIKVDISTGDVITPDAVRYSYPLMFEDRSISLWTYNLETLLAEKLETIMARGVANTRLRDFYDINILTQQKAFDKAVLREAFLATSKQRSTEALIPEFSRIVDEVESDETMLRLWESYRSASFFVGDLSWSDVMASVRQLMEFVR